MKVVDIFDGNQNLIERVVIEDLEFNPETEVISMLKYAQNSVYEYAYYNWMDNENISSNEYSVYHEKADRYAVDEANYAGWKIKNIQKHI